MHTASADDLARTRAAFDSWRASHTGRRRIPDHLWAAALPLLDRYSPSRVSRELRLSATQLRKRRLSAARARKPGAATATHFVQVQAADLGLGHFSSVETTADSQTHSAASALRLTIERTDGSRLTLCLPLSEWTRLEALCAAFFRS